MEGAPDINTEDSFDRAERIEKLREEYSRLRKIEREIEDRIDQIIQDPFSQKSRRTPKLLKDLSIELDNARVNTREAFDTYLESTL